MEEFKPSRYQAAKEINRDQTRRFQIPKKKQELDEIVELEMGALVRDENVGLTDCRRFIPPQPKEEESIEPENKYKCCCFRSSTDKRLLIFSASLSLSLIIIIFSCYQLVNLTGCHEQNTYVGLLTLILGIWLRSPI